MLHISSDILIGWVAWIILPLVRVLSFITATPILGHQAVPARVKLCLGIAITFAVMPMVKVPTVDLMSGLGVLLIAQQIMIGFAMGLVVRIAFSAVEMAGQVAGMTMGLGFATFYDPQSQGQTVILSQYLYVITSLIFLAIDGHLILISVLAQSFQSMPVDAGTALHFDYKAITLWGSKIFSAGMLISMPIVACLLITNMALGVLSRTAPSLNLFGIGFPITLGIGFLMFALLLPGLLDPIQRLLHESMDFTKILLNVS